MLIDEVREKIVAAVSNGDVCAVRQLACEYRALFSSRIGAAELSVLLRLALKLQFSDVAEVLLRSGADVAHEDTDGRRVLHLAAEIGNLSVVKLLLQAGAMLNSVDRNGNSALHLCAAQGHHNVCMLLINSGASVNRPRRYDNGEAPLHAIARTGDSTVLQLALNRAGGRPDLNASNGTTPLHIAAREHHASCVEALCSTVSRVSYINVTDNSKLTPLHCAVQAAALQCVRILLQHHADANAVDSDGLSPLHYAANMTQPATYCHAGIVDLLIAFGADARHRDFQLRTPLHVAAAVGNSSLVGLLVAAGADVDAKERILGETALNIAAAYGRHSVLSEIIQAECSVNIADKHGVTPLHKLLSSGANVDAYKYHSVDLLLRHGARINVADDRGITPLQACVFHAIISRHSGDGLSVLRRLVAAGAMLGPDCHGAQRAFRNSPLCWLTWHGELTAAAFLINAGWRLHNERWIALTGKTPAMETFLSSVRIIASNPWSLRAVCRDAIRTRMLQVSEDKDIVPLMEKLPLPSQIVSYLNFDTECDILN